MVKKAPYTNGVGGGVSLGAAKRREKGLLKGGVVGRETPDITKKLFEFKGPSLAAVWRGGWEEDLLC